MPSAVTSAVPARRPPELSLFYSADLRGNGAPQGATGPGGLARRATLIDRARIEKSTVVQVDAGDLVAVSGDHAELDTPEKLERRARLIFAVVPAHGCRRHHARRARARYRAGTLAKDSERDRRRGGRRECGRQEG